jgi:ribonuclease D
MSATLPTVDYERLAADARAAGELGVDTEFMTEGRYHPLLCLVQVSVADAQAPDGVRVELVDPIEHAGDDPGPLAAVLADPDVAVVLHAARQDVALLRRVWQTEVTSVFDTQVAAGFAGFSAQPGYVNLLGETLKIRLPKSAGFTRWDARPLTEEQLEYARADVEHLLALAADLRERLVARGRLDWVRDECRPLESSTDVRDPEEVWRRLPKINQLSGRGRAVARVLAAWRERTAAEEDRPVGSVLGDPALVEIARRQPEDERALSQIRGVHQGIVRKRAAGVLDAVARGLEEPPQPRESEGGIGLEPGDGPVIALAESLLRGRALAEGLAYEVLATRADLNRVVAAARRGDPEPDVRVLRGWRREVAGEDLLALLAGRRGVSVDPDGRLRVSMSEDEPG